LRMPSQDVYTLGRTLISSDLSHTDSLDTETLKTYRP